MAQGILAEDSEHHDIRVVPMRDQYMDLSNKVISIMAYGYWFTNASFIGTHDDEYCLKVDQLPALALHEEGQLLYGGQHQWTGLEYKSMTGPHRHGRFVHEWVGLLP